MGLHLQHDTYLGDGAYAAQDEYTGDVVLYTSDGYRLTNTVVLEPEVLAKFLKFIREKIMGEEGRQS